MVINELQENLKVPWSINSIKIKNNIKTLKNISKYRRLRDKNPKYEIKDAEKHWRNSNIKLLGVWKSDHREHKGDIIWANVW